MKFSLTHYTGEIKKGGSSSALRVYFYKPAVSLDQELFDDGSAREPGCFTEFLFDPEELAVFVHAFAAGKGAGLDLTGVHKLVAFL